jgi:outer membrane protein OmpA-like peptidoglycan-associated protein
MKMKLLAALMAVGGLSVQPDAARASEVASDTLVYTYNRLEDIASLEVEPVYLPHTVEGCQWPRNWFVELRGGVSAFLGSPLGRGDLFDRLHPTVHFEVGKWFTPAIGLRLGFQGLELKDSRLQHLSYRHYHLDAMWNVLGYYTASRGASHYWELSPFLGTGITVRPHTDAHPFTLHYGLAARYHIGPRLLLLTELGGWTTFKDFDGRGDSRQWGDRQLSLSAGLGLTLGRSGWKRVLDAQAYLYKYSDLLQRMNALQASHRLLLEQRQTDADIIAEYRKILQIEGLLERYADRLKLPSVSKPPYPVNNYSGLNSLRARLRHRNWNGTDERNASELADSLDGDFLMKEDGMAMNADGMNSFEDAGTVGWEGLEGFEPTFIGFPLNADSLSANADSLSSLRPAPSSPSDLQTVRKNYLKQLAKGKKALGAPIYFFFRLGTDELTEPAQLLNVDGLAKLAITYHLKVGISGAADSATGTDEINRALSRNRAERMKQLLLERSVPEDRIFIRIQGGIDSYEPQEANRHTRITLTL